MPDIGERDRREFLPDGKGQAMLEIDVAARCFAELGHPVRLSIYRRLVQAGDAGMAVGALGTAFGMVPSSFSHHIKGLLEAGLIEQVREGRVLRCRPLYGRMEALVAFLTEECCTQPEPQAMQSPAADCCT